MICKYRTLISSKYALKCLFPSMRNGFYFFTAYIRKSLYYLCINFLNNLHVSAIKQYLIHGLFTLSLLSILFSKELSIEWAACRFLLPIANILANLIHYILMTIVLYFSLCCHGLSLSLLIVRALRIWLTPSKGFFKHVLHYSFWLGKLTQTVLVIRSTQIIQSFGNVTKKRLHLMEMCIKS